MGDAKKRRLITYNPAIDVETQKVDPKRREPWQPQVFWSFVERLEAAEPGSAAMLDLPTGVVRRRDTGSPVIVQVSSEELAAGPLRPVLDVSPAVKQQD
jgi:hypothetical protein